MARKSRVGGEEIGDSLGRREKEGGHKLVTNCGKGGRIVAKKLAKMVRKW